jgi:hypothetical protein
LLTLRLGIERILIEKVPGVTEIISIRPDDIDIDAFAGGNDDDE